MTIPVRVVAPGEGALMRGGSHQLKAGVDDTAGAVTVWVSSTAYRKGPPLHLHEREDELFYVVAGRYELTCGSESVSAEAGCLMFLPRLTPHVFRSVDEFVPGRLLHFCVPGGLELYFAAIGDSDAATEEGRALRRAAGDRFGLRFPKEPTDRLPGAERQPPFLVRDAAHWPNVDDTESGAATIPRLDASETAGRIGLSELFVAPGADWRLPECADWRVAHLLSGELEPSTAAARIGVGATLIVAPGAACSGRSCGGPPARLVVVTVPAARG